MLKKINNHITNNFSFLKDKKLLIACSGGLDSVVLSRLLKELKFNLSLAHCNFSLRGKESDGDEKFVETLADKLSIPVFTKTFNTKQYAKELKMSTQMAARNIRYTWFEELIQQYSFDYLLTAHHLDDDLETFFINLSRGTGLRGLTGIPDINEKIIRPLLSFSREEILAYAQEKNISWREDSSNSKSDYLRNKLRLEVIPNYKELSDSVLSSFQQTQSNLQDSQLLVNDYMVLIQALVVAETREGLAFNIQKLKELPNTKALLYELLSSYGFTAWGDISDLLEAQSGKQVHSNSHRLIKNRDVLLLTEILDKDNVEILFISEDLNEIEFPVHLKFESAKSISETNKNTVYIDNQKLKYPLELRKWKEGDVFNPFGMKGKKKLSKFFKDEKLSLVAKEKIWVLVSDNKIVWVVGMRSDSRFKVGDDTNDILKITFIEI